jgi:hypothetical protein
MRIIHGLIPLALGAAFLSVPTLRAADPKIPAPLASYRAWKALTSSPRPIPYQLAQLCASVQPGQPSPTNPDGHGPHTNRWVMAYANPAADSALTSASMARFPVGAILAKEKRLSVDAAHPEGVAFMVKHRAGEFSASGGWEFLYFPSAGASADYSGCVDCHRTRGTKDYVFGKYGP